MTSETRRSESQRYIDTSVDVSVAGAMVCSLASAVTARSRGLTADDRDRCRPRTPPDGTVHSIRASSARLLNSSPIRLFNTPGLVLQAEIERSREIDFLWP